MTELRRIQTRRERTWIHVAACLLLGAAVVASLILFEAAEENRQAQEKADEFIAALDEAGASIPDRDQVVRVLGDDGGATCKDPSTALRNATLLALLSNGATGPGSRPVVVDSRVLRGQALIIEIYCPDELDDYLAFVARLKTDDVVKD